jgi:GNAT superfamily N-acetyltransferase
MTVCWAGTIRRATGDDASDIATLYHELIERPDIDVLPERLTQIASDPNTALFVCEGDSRLLATALVSLCADVMYGFQPYAVIENFVVDSDFRRKGVGTALITHIENFCLDADCSKIMILSAMNRVSAHSFFEDAGFAGTSKRGFVKYRRSMRRMANGT